MPLPGEPINNAGAADVLCTWGFRQSPLNLHSGDDSLSLLAFWLLAGVAIGTFAIFENWGKITRIIHRWHR